MNESVIEKIVNDVLYLEYDDESVREGGRQFVREVHAAKDMIEDTLRALVKKGPLEDGCVPSKRERDELLSMGLAAKVIVNGQQGYQAATYKGYDALKIIDALRAL